MSTLPLRPNSIRCKDGHTFSVGPKGERDRPGASIVVYASFRDPLRSSSGLARFENFHEPGDACAEHTGMTIEIVRAYARAHGGVAEAGEKALEFLKRLPSATEPAPIPEAPPEPEPAPVPEASPAVEEAASRPFPEARRQGRPAPRFPPETRHLVTPPPEALLRSLSTS